MVTKPEAIQNELYLQKLITKILKAAQIVFDEGIGYPILLGDEKKIKNIAAANGIDIEGFPFLIREVMQWKKKEINMPKSFSKNEAARVLIL